MSFTPYVTFANGAAGATPISATNLNSSFSNVASYIDSRLPFFYPEDYGTVTAGGVVDNSTAFQAVSDAAAAAGGGIVIIRTPGLYACKSVSINSNTTWLSLDGVKYTYYTSEINKEIFSFNEFSSANYVENCAFIGGEFDLTAISGGVTGLHCIRVWGAKNYRIENVKATKSDYGCIAHISRGTGTYTLYPQNGFIRNLKFVGAANDNFGALQINGCRGLSVDGLYGEMGIDLRLENDGQNFYVEDVVAQNIRHVGTGKAAAITCHNEPIRRIKISRVYVEGSGTGTAGMSIWNATGTIAITDVHLEDWTCNNAPLFSPGQTLGNLVHNFVVENVNVYGITDTTANGAIGIFNATYLNCRVHDNLCAGWRSLWATDASDLMSPVLINCKGYRNGAHPGLRFDNSARQITLIDCEFYDDRDITNADGTAATLTGEKLTANQQGIETDTTGFSTVSNASLARDITIFRTGAASLKHTLTTTGSNSTIATSAGLSGFAVTPGAVYTAQVYCKSGTETRQVRLELRWYDSAGTTISTTTGSYYYTNPGFWTLLHNSFTAPANAAFGALRMTINGTAAVSGESVYYDDLSVKTGGAQQLMTYGIWGSATKNRLVIRGGRLEYGPGGYGFFNAQQTDYDFTDLYDGRASNLGRNVASTATAGSGTLPAAPVGFLVVNILGTDRKIPYYAV